MGDRVISLINRLHYMATAQVFCNNGQSTCDTGLPTVTANNSALTTVLQLGFGIIGGIALIMVIISAISFVISSGEEQKVKQARETLLYALIGLVVCICAEVVVTFVLSNV